MKSLQGGKHSLHFTSLHLTQLGKNKEGLVATFPSVLCPCIINRRTSARTSSHQSQPTGLQGEVLVKTKKKTQPLNTLSWFCRSLRCRLVGAFAGSFFVAALVGAALVGAASVGAAFVGAFLVGAAFVGATSAEAVRRGLPLVWLTRCARLLQHSLHAARQHLHPRGVGIASFGAALVGATSVEAAFVDVTSFAAAAAARPILTISN